MRTRLAFVVLLAATLGNLLVAIVVVHKTSTRIVDNPTDTVVGEPAGVEMRIAGLHSAVSVRMRSSTDAPWVTALPPDVGFLPGSASFRGVATRAEVEVCSWGPLGLLGYSALAVDRPASHPLDRTAPDRLGRADRPRAPHWPVALRAGRRRG